nr:hypothetical protein CTI12_AA112170 [Tanacetum cinerariifolium]
MHNNIMAAGSRDRPPMLATGRYAQWRSHILKNIDTRPNGDALMKCILKDPYYQAPKSHKPYAPTSKQASSTRSNASTKFKGKEIAKPITPPSESASEEDSDPKQAQRDKDRNQRIVNAVGARETLGSQVVQQTWIQCFNCKEFGHFAKEKQSNWLADMNEEIDEQELEAHYSYMAKIQEVPTTYSGTDYEPLEQTDQNVVECNDEHVELANLIANLKLDVNEHKKIQKKLKKTNTALAHELIECKSIFAKTSRTLRDSNSIRDSCLVAIQTKQSEFERYKTLNDHTVDYDKLEHKLNETLGLLAQKEIDIKECLKLKAYEISAVNEKNDELVKQSLLTKSHYEGLVKKKSKAITVLKLMEERALTK